MSERQQYNELEKNLIQKLNSNQKNNEAVLRSDDFNDGQLSVSGYDHLKQLCDYIPYSEKIEIKIPKEYEAGFKDTLDYMGAIELSNIKKDRRATRLTALLLLLGGIWCFIIGSILEHRELLMGIIFGNITIIISWVFVWAAVEKWFFDTKELRQKRKSLLQILSAKITAQ